MSNDKVKEVLQRILKNTEERREYLLENKNKQNYKNDNNIKDLTELTEVLSIAINSLDELTRLNQHIASLTHYWREKDDKAFKERLQMIEQEYREKGKEDLAEYIRVQYSDCMRWVPM